jgi:hypothetical protein
MAQLNAIVDMLLTQASSAYVPQDYLSEQILPEIQSKNSTGKLAKYGLSHIRPENSTKGGRGAYRRVETITRSDTSFAIDGHGLEGIVTKEDYKNVILPYKAEEDEVLGLSTSLWVEKEKLLADTLTSTAIMTQNTTLSGTGQLNDYLNSDPISKFNVARKAVRDGCGLPPNMAIMDWAVWNQVRFHPQMLDALGFKQNRPGGLSKDEMAVAMGVDQVLIGQAMYNSAKEGQTDVLAPTWGKHIVFAVAPAKAVTYQVSLGYMVRYEGEQPRKVYKYPTQNPPDGMYILVEDNYDMLISNVAAGYLIYNAIA